MCTVFLVFQMRLLTPSSFCMYLHIANQHYVDGICNLTYYLTYRSCWKLLGSFVFAHIVGFSGSYLDMLALQQPHTGLSLSQVNLCTSLTKKTKCQQHVRPLNCSRTQKRPCATSILTHKWQHPESLHSYWIWEDPELNLFRRNSHNSEMCGNSQQILLIVFLPPSNISYMMFFFVSAKNANMSIIQTSSKPWCLNICSCILKDRHEHLAVRSKGQFVQLWAVISVGLT